MTGITQRARILILAVATLLLAALATVTLLRARQAGVQGSPGDVPRAPAAAVGDDGLRAGPRLTVLSDGLLSSVSITDPSGPRDVTSQRCDRAYTAGGTTACLTPVGALGTTRLLVLDPDLRTRRSVTLTGFPNRTRVSADGRMVAWTLFVGGHSYSGGGFSTRTGILDTRSGELTGSLEVFTVLRDGRRYRAPDVNIWGVTFAADDDRFYATLSSSGTRSLVEGSVSARTLRILTENVECPSLSPDGTRVAFKQAVDADPAKGWRLSVLDLPTLHRTGLAETRSVDDQAAWLDDGTVAYAIQRSDGVDDVWTVPADGTGAPRLLVSGAVSPSPPVASALGHGTRADAVPEGDGVDPSG
ncbi:hypothetical protein [Streptomyces sp. NPDC048577]|uniref:hypothetical protein n=1 Tax=Streptomyces sp. NPDC048577 TaxID=3157209 RepID=UPI003413822B